MNLKEALLSFDGVVDNEYLDQYVELVNSTISFSSTDYTEKHHVIPVSFYKDKKDPNVSYHVHKRDVAEADSRNFITYLSIITLGIDVLDNRCFSTILPIGDNSTCGVCGTSRAPYPTMIFDKIGLLSFTHIVTKYAPIDP